MTQGMCLNSRPVMIGLVCPLCPQPGQVVVSAVRRDSDRCPQRPDHNWFHKFGSYSVLLYHEN